MITPDESPEPSILADATCPACGLLCDDIALTVSGGRILDAARACDRGKSWFLADHCPGDAPEACIDGQPASLDDAIARASALLSESRAIAIAGLSTLTIEAQSLACRLADRLGAVIGHDRVEEARPRILAQQRAGAVLGSFGEVAQRADVILLWGVDPAATHPRLRERLIDRPGRFVPEGRAGRIVLVVDSGASECRSWADDALAVPDLRHAEAIDALRAAVGGIAADPGRVERQSGTSFDRWQSWADRLKSARYGAILFGAGLAKEGSEAVESLMRLLDDLNQSTRWVSVPLAGLGNPSGAEAILTSRLGSPMAVDLSDGKPRFRPLDADPEARIRAGEADALLVLGDPPEGLMESLPAGLLVVRIGPGATIGAPKLGVSIASATPTIDDGGTFYRSDEVALPIRPALGSGRPSMVSLLGTLGDRLAATQDQAVSR